MKLINKILCRLFGHRISVEKSPRPAEYFLVSWIIKCERCGFTKDVIYKK